VDGVVHYCVANMPGAVPVTSTWGLAEATLPYALKLANYGLKAAADPVVRRGINTFEGQVTHPGVATSLNLPLKQLNPEDF